MYHQNTRNRRLQRIPCKKISFKLYESKFRDLSNQQKIKLKEVHFGPTEREKLKNIFLEATTIISKKPDHRSNGTQKTRGLCRHCNTHIIIGTIFTVAMIQGYDPESQAKKGRGFCALYMRESV